MQHVDLVIEEINDLVVLTSYDRLLQCDEVRLQRLETAAQDLTATRPIPVPPPDVERGYRTLSGTQPPRRESRNC